MPFCSPRLEMPARTLRGFLTHLLKRSMLPVVKQKESKGLGPRVTSLLEEEEKERISGNLPDVMFSHEVPRKTVLAST